MREFIVSEDFHPEVRGYAELVRCKDCRFHCDEGERDSVPQWLPCAEVKTDDNWFCGYGDKKMVAPVTPMKEKRDGGCENCPEKKKCDRRFDLALAGVVDWKCVMKKVCEIKDGKTKCELLTS